MAKKKQGKKTRHPQVWVPEPDDAIRLAALRWFALEMERISIEIYATDKRKFALMEKVLRGTIAKLNFVRENLNALSDDECPDGYIRCKDGTCAPSCDGFADASNDES